MVEGDDPDGNDPDVCLDVRTATMRLCIEDRDNDGWNDTEDQFPDEPTQWVDADGDGLGDNKAGYAGDPFLGDKDNDGFLDPSDPVYDEEGRLLPSSLKEEDVFPDNPSEWSDNDGDLVGDNGDPDDDNDGALDSDELLLGYDAFSSQSTPPESFEIVLTERISLEAWDLVSIALGVPSGLYIIFAFLTRGLRARAFKKRIEDAEDVGELELVGEEFEDALMRRLIGPHPRFASSEVECARRWPSWVDVPNRIERRRPPATQHLHRHRTRESSPMAAQTNVST